MSTETTEWMRMGKQNVQATMPTNFAQIIFLSLLLLTLSKLHLESLRLSWWK